MAKAKKVKETKLEVKPPAKPKGLTKKQVLDRVGEITKAMDYFRDRGQRFGFTPPADEKSWVALRGLVEAAKSME